MTTRPTQTPAPAGAARPEEVTLLRDLTRLLPTEDDLTELDGLLRDTEQLATDLQDDDPGRAKLWSDTFAYLEQVHDALSDWHASQRELDELIPDALTTDPATGGLTWATEQT